MPDTTPIHGLPFPEDTDPANVPGDIGDLANALDPLIVAVTLADAKGDLFVSPAPDTLGRLAVGTNGHVLTADSAQTLGVHWAAPSGGGATTLDDLTDVDTTGAADDEVLTYDAATATWQPAPGGTGGTGGDPSTDTQVWMPLIDTDGALVLDDSGLIPTLIPIA